MKPTSSKNKKLSQKEIYNARIIVQKMYNKHCKNMKRIKSHEPFDIGYKFALRKVLDRFDECNANKEISK